MKKAISLILVLFPLIIGLTTPALSKASIKLDKGWGVWMDICPDRIECYPGDILNIGIGLNNFGTVEDTYDLGLGSNKNFMVNVDPWYLAISSGSVDYAAGNIIVSEKAEAGEYNLKCMARSRAMKTLTSERTLTVVVKKDLSYRVKRLWKKIFGREMTLEEKQKQILEKFKRKSETIKI